MRDAVRQIFPGWSQNFEGAVPWFYADLYGWITIAIGNLVDLTDVTLTSAPEVALRLPMVRKDTGEPATREEIAADWLRAKTHPTAAHDGHRVLEHVTQLRLTPDGIAQVVTAKMDEMAGELLKQYPDFEDWCCDAQLATLSMSWACGSHFGRIFPSLKRALLAGDFARAAIESHINTDGPDKTAGTRDDNRGVIPRNAANKALFLCAASTAAGLDPDAFSYPPLAGAAPTDPPPAPDQLLADQPIVHPDVDLGNPTDRDPDA